jgi:hypothetical protein
MLRGCLLSLALYAALAAAYFWWMDRVFERPGSFFGAAAVALVVFFCLGALGNAVRDFRTWRMLAAAHSNLPPREGKTTVVAGKIYPTGQPLTAPFSGEDCVVCEYDLASQARTARASEQENVGSDFAGFLMTPCVIRSRLGDVRLLGFPILEGFESYPCHGYAAARNARKFLETTPFEDRSGLKVVSVLSVFSEVWSDDDGFVQKNLRLSKVALDSLFPPESNAELDRLATEETERYAAMDDDEDEEELDDENFDENLDDELGEAPARDTPRLTEKKVYVGDEVCAIGVYNEMKRGLLPPKGRQPNRLLRGSAEQIEQASRRSFWRMLIGGLVVLVIVHAVAYGLMQAYLHRS